MELNEVSRLIVDAAYRIHVEVGPGLLESVYEIVLAGVLMEKGLRVERQVPVSIRLGDKVFQEGFRADLVVDARIIIEIKSVRYLEPVFKKQLLTYLKLSGISLGLVINFGGETLKGNIERLAVGSVPPLPPQKDSSREDSHREHREHREDKQTE